MRTAEHARFIVEATGKVALALAAAMLVPAAVALVLGEWNDLSALLIGAGIAGSTGAAVGLSLPAERSAGWSHGFATIALGWMTGSVLAAVPLFLSGHYGSFLDAVFEGMSGLTTTGLTLIQDLDHLGVAMNLWRHGLQLIGGVAIVVVVLTVYARGSSQVATSNVPDARDERILPNVITVSRFVLAVVTAFAAVGVGALLVGGLFAGLSLPRASYHAVALFTSAFDTGGFGVTSASVALYHSPLVETVVVVLMLCGAVSFIIHQQLWLGIRSELFRNVESRIFVLTLVAFVVVVLGGLLRAGTFDSAGALYRKGVFTTVAAHVTSGLTVSAPRLIATDWGPMAPAALVAAMTLGGMAASTSGGLKSLRLAMIAKGVVRDIRRVLMPESALVVETYHQRRRHTLTDGHVRDAATILLLLLFTVLTGAIVALFFVEGIDLTESLFESASAVSNTGVSIGVLTPSSPPVVKLLYLGQMWVGRLEFLAVLALFGLVLLRPGDRR